MEQRARNWATHQIAVRAAKLTLSALESGGIQALPVKGVILGREIDDPAVGPISDVDLLIRRADFGRAINLAKKAGWALVWDSKALGNVNFIVEGVAIDVACHFGPAGVSATNVASVLERATRSEQPLGFSHWQIEVHDHALLLAIDAFKDKLGRGKPWAREDLVRIVDTTGFSPDVLVERASAARLRTMLAIVANWVISSGPSLVWSSVREHISSRPIRNRYMKRYQNLVQTEEASRWRQLYVSAVTRTVSDAGSRRALALGLGIVGTAAFVARHGNLDADVWMTRAAKDADR